MKQKGCRIGQPVMGAEGRHPYADVTFVYCQRFMAAFFVFG